MRSTVRWLAYAGLVAIVLAVWRASACSPVPRPLRPISEPPESTEIGSPAVGVEYVLADGEEIRHIPVPDPALRRKLFSQSGLARRQGSPPIVSVTAFWDGTARIRSVQSGLPMFPRSLLDVLTHSLEVPLYALEGIEVGKEIELAGDWVVRTDADLDRCMSYVEGVVQRSGHPGFRIERQLRTCVAYEIGGVASAPNRPIQLFQPHPEVSPAREEPGTLLRFGQALREAIRRPVSVSAEPKDLRVAWQDNSRGYLAFGDAISDEMITEVLDDVAQALGVTISSSEVEITVWRMERDR